MQYFTMGTWVLGLSLAVSLAGTLVGLTCIRQSTLSVTAKFRLVWLTAAAVSIGVVGTWLAASVTLLGVGVPTGQIHYDLTLRSVGAVLTLAAVLAGLLIAGRTPTPARLGGGAAVMGLGLALMNYLGMSAIDVQGRVDINPAETAGATALAIVLALGLLWATRLRGMIALLGVSALYAAGVVAMHYIGLAGVRVHLDPAMPQPGGQDLFTVFIPVFVLGTLSLAIPITAILVAPDRSGRLQPTRPQENSRPAQPVG